MGTVLSLLLFGSRLETLVGSLPSAPATSVSKLFPLPRSVIEVDISSAPESLFLLVKAGFFAPSAFAVDSSPSAVDPGSPNAIPLFFLAFFLLGSAAPGLGTPAGPAAVGGSGRF